MNGSAIAKTHQCQTIGCINQQLSWKRKANPLFPPSAIALPPRVWLRGFTPQVIRTQHGYPAICKKLN
jgi:hypothetical protein